MRASNTLNGSDAALVQSVVNRLDRFHAWTIAQPGLRLLTVVVRTLLALAFISSGLVKILGERFTLPLHGVPTAHLARLHHQSYAQAVAELALSAAIVVAVFVRLGFGAASASNEPRYNRG